MNDMSNLSNTVIAQSLAGRRLENKSVILTGAAGSIGRYISRHLLREGARVTMTGRDQTKLDAFVGELAEEGFDAENITTIVGDCADPQVCRDIVSRAVDSFGKLDVLVNNAGAAGPKYTLRDIPFTDVEMRAPVRPDHVRLCHEPLGAPWNITSSSGTPRWRHDRQRFDDLFAHPLLRSHPLRGARRPNAKRLSLSWVKSAVFE